ncbi:MAG: hypothetical protein DRK00_10795 [Thermoprotei archaeon]|nr:MAG: hypothetical protein DRK00_10795 [Thermoprotei archaeon]
MTKLKAGVGVRVITPPVGVPLGGYAARVEPARGVHDDLHARALVLEADGERAALVSLELLYATRDLVEEVRKVCEEEAGIPPDSVMVTAVHTHSGPSLVGFHSTPRHRYLEEYLHLLPGLVASAVIEASRKLVEVNVRYGRGRVDGWLVNRRKPGEGPIDPEVSALCLEHEGDALCTIVNFACHAVVLGHNNLLISADYPGYVSKTVEHVLGGSCLFLNGACGDVNPLTPGTSLERVYDRSIGTFRHAEEMGTAVACEAVKALLGSRPSSARGVWAARRSLELRVRELPRVSSEELETTRRAFEDALARGDWGEASKLRFKLAMMELVKRVGERCPGGVLRTEVQALRVGDVVIVGLPGEPFVEVGLRIKSSSRASLTMVAGYANDAIGYLPTDEAFEEGGYEVSLPVCIVERGAADKLVNEAVKLVEELLAKG